MRRSAVSGSRGLPDLRRFCHFCCPASSLSLSRLPGLTGCLFPQLLIKLKTRTSTEYLLEACSREERDAWAFEITGAIHAGQPGKVQQLHLLKNSFKLPPHISLQCVPGPALAPPGFAAASAVCPPQEGPLWPLHGPGWCCSGAPGPVGIVFSRWEWPCQPALVTSWGPCCSCPPQCLDPLPSVSTGMLRAIQTAPQESPLTKSLVLFAAWWQERVFCYELHSCSVGFFIHPSIHSFKK